jgi:hypothetical protein
MDSNVLNKRCLSCLALKPKPVAPISTRLGFTSITGRASLFKNGDSLSTIFSMASTSTAEGHIIINQPRLLSFPEYDEKLEKEQSEKFQSFLAKAALPSSGNRSYIVPIRDICPSHLVVAPTVMLVKFSLSSITFTNSRRNGTALFKFV